MRSSPRHYLIIIEERSVADDGLGGEEETWVVIGQEFAAVFYGSGSEQREAAQRAGSQAASFEVLSNSMTRSLSVIDHRIVYGGGIWDISAMQDLGLNDGVRITAVRQRL